MVSGVMTSRRSRQGARPPAAADLWPNLRTNRNYRTDEIRALDVVEWQKLTKLVRGRLRGAPLSQAAKRQFREIKRRLTRRRGERHVPLRTEHLIAKQQPCVILDALMPDRARRWQPIVRRKARPNIDLRAFSFVLDPIGTMRQLAQVAAAEATGRSVTMSFLDEVCMDVSPYLVLGLMRRTMAPVLTGGRITPSIRSMITALGLREFLNMQPIKADARDPTFLPFRVRYSNEAARQSENLTYQPSAIEKLCDDLVDTVSNWLLWTKGGQLTKKGKGNVARIVNEPLDNGVRHADLGGRGNWATAGFLSRVTKIEHDGQAREVTTCSLAIVSTGSTIADTIMTCENPHTLDRIHRYIDLHAAPSRPADLLATVFALQDGVSRFLQGEGSSRGGVGIMDMLQLVMELGQTTRAEDAPTVTLISGRSCTIVRPPFAPLPPQAGDISLREVWFNDANDVDLPPDETHVFTLPCGFPGTIIAIRFCLDPTFVVPPAQPK